MEFLYWHVMLVQLFWLKIGEIQIHKSLVSQKNIPIYRRRRLLKQFDTDIGTFKIIVFVAIVKEGYE